MLNQGREATFTKHGVSWIGIKTDGSQKIRVIVLLAWYGWSHISHGCPEPVAGGFYIRSLIRSR